MVGLRLSVVVLATWLAGCAASPVAAPRLDLDWSHDPQAGFTGFVTYAWLPGLRLSAEDPRVDSALLEKRIREAVSGELEAKGYQRKLAGTPSFYVSYEVSMQGKLDVHAVSRGYGFDPAWGGMYQGQSGRGAQGMAKDVKEADHGTLILDVIEPAENKLIWRGTVGTRVFPDTDTERRKIERINDAVKRLLARFPPHGR
jgi:hypothetical protein